jgi:hypothetical protein
VYRQARNYQKKKINSTNLVCGDDVFRGDEGQDVEGVDQRCEVSTSGQEGEELQFADLLANSFKDTIIGYGFFKS